ncbi:prolipoprotein diacylglyceryl transferase [Mycolicibacterium sp. 050158]|uniref:prolipoprotein diacylglyceryl transferase n=1 Tax=Mycolicibacterium sp. 050158 TaxID=3090602 RepID=UPI00299DBF4C|nr:prolipoprotein diacylglyceryl transferase [Mycolicibacterium sp. 050158]MDX1893388.1 prolipoprotein diacylglyceryl transferase [Mycolicibacterium sp. 050158]
MVLAYLPSPSQGVWHVGPIPIRAYALCIIAGIVIAIWLTQRRWTARGGNPDDILDIAMWAVPFGIVGGRLYHVITDPELYFLPGRDPIKAFYIWDGGLGIWGAVALGALGAWIGCRRRGIHLLDFGDALAPGLILAQAIGRWGNYFNQELYGRPTTLPWAVQIDPAHRPADTPQIGLYHPTFLYESLWNVAVALLLLWVDRRFTVPRGKLFALYVAAYTVGRGAIEALRIDHANHFLGLRLNDWTSLIVFLGALTVLLWPRRDPPATEESAANHEPSTTHHPSAPASRKPKRSPE